MPEKAPKLSGLAAIDLTTYKRRSLRGVLKARAEEPGSRVMKVLGWIPVGTEAIAGAAKEIQRREQGLMPEPLGQAVLKGIEEHASFADLATTPHGRLLGYGADFLIAPEWLIPFGKIAGLAGRGIVGAGKAARTVKPLRAVIDAAGKKFYRPYALKVDNLSDFMDIVHELHGNVNVLRAAKVAEAQDQIARLVPSEKRRWFLSLLHDADPAQVKAYLPKMTAEEREAFDIGRKFIKELENTKIEKTPYLTAERAAGLEAASGGRTYLPRRTATRKNSLEDVQETIRLFEQEVGKAPKELQVYQRELFDMPDEVYSAVRQKGMEMAEGGHLPKHFPEAPKYGPAFTKERKFKAAITEQSDEYLKWMELDYAKIMGIEDRLVARAMAENKFIDSAIKYLENKNLIFKIEKGGAIGPGGMTLKKLKVKGYEGYMAPASVVDEIDSVFKAYTDARAIGETISVWRNITSYYKAITLPGFPSYHLRNLVSNLWLNHLAGMGIRALPDYRLGAELMQKFARGDLSGTVKIGNKIHKIEDLYQQALKNRALSGGMYTEFSDIFKVTGKAEFAKMLYHPGHNPWIQAGFKFGRAIEDHARFSHFLWKVRKGASFKEAGKSVQKYLFDYEYGLTKWESKYLRHRLMPFYAWTRFNIPLALETLAMQPAKYGNFIRFQKAIENEFGGPKPSEVVFQQWLRESSKIRISWDEKTGTYRYFFLNSYYPGEEIGKVLSGKRFVREAINLLTPVLKVPFELLANYSTFRGRKIKEYPGQRARLLGVPLLPRAEHFFRSFRVLNEADQVVKAMDKKYGGGILTRAKHGVERVLFSKPYPVQPSKQRRAWDFETQILLRELGAARSRARKKGYWDDVKTCEKEMAKVKWLREKHLRLGR